MIIPGETFEEQRYRNSCRCNGNFIFLDISGQIMVLQVTAIVYFTTLNSIMAIKAERDYSDQEIGVGPTYTFELCSFIYRWSWIYDLQAWEMYAAYIFAAYFLNIKEQHDILLKTGLFLNSALLTVSRTCIPSWSVMSSDHFYLCECVARFYFVIPVVCHGEAYF